MYFINQLLVTVGFIILCVLYLSWSDAYSKKKKQEKDEELNRREWVDLQKEIYGDLDDNERDETC